MSCVTYKKKKNKNKKSFLAQSVGATQWRVCYQWGPTPSFFLTGELSLTIWALQRRKALGRKRVTDPLMNYDCLCRAAPGFDQVN